ncbi:MAG: hypothetical protein JW909_01010 [Planctomycetes bacterium]|nr:hypothetical protein [Planctomycetota bacterium]
MTRDWLEEFKEILRSVSPDEPDDGGGPVFPDDDDSASGGLFEDEPLMERVFDDDPADAAFLESAGPAPEPLPGDGDTADIVTAHDLGELVDRTPLPGDEEKDPKAVTGFSRAVQDMFQNLVNELGQVKDLAGRRLARQALQRSELDVEESVDDDNRFYDAVERMFEEIRTSAGERLREVHQVSVEARRELREVEARLRERESENERLRSEIDSERSHLRAMEDELASLRQRMEQQAAESVDNAYYQELMRRLNEAYSLLAAIEEAYLTSAD